MNPKLDIRSHRGTATQVTLEDKQLKQIKQSDSTVKTMLVRIPMISEAEDVVKFADVSLNSEIKTLKVLEETAKKLNIKHSVIIMFDLGDLREGCFDELELLKLGQFAEKSKYLHLLGVGTNLSCYGSILPTEINMNRLVQVTETLEESIDRKLEIISGGATSTFPMLDDDKLNPRINHLRMGEGILNNMDLPFYRDINYPMYDDAFILKAEIIEIKQKPSYPIGEKSMDAYGNIPEYVDKGIQTRAILAVGNQDIGSYTKLVPMNKNVELIGASSDHLIVSVNNDSDYDIGDIMEFKIFYPSMLYLSNSSLVKKEYVYALDEQ